MPQKKYEMILQINRLHLFSLKASCSVPWKKAAAIWSKYFAVNKTDKNCEYTEITKMPLCYQIAETWKK